MLGINLSDRQVEDFMVYYEYLIEQNKVLNLTGITEFEEVMVKHFVDSLSIVKAVDIEKCNTLIDVGTGAGFPGLPLKIAYPHLQVVLLDSLNKRINFLNTVIDKIHIDGITSIHGRAEDIARMPEYREKFDLAVSRAVANLSSLSEYCLPFVKVNGCFISYKSKEVEEELKGAERAISILGGKIEKKEEFMLPDSDIGRSLVVIRKMKHISGKYPRKAGMPSKEPL
jgi:16S rRNA (guanine527-N7)-methyltransferase